MKPHGDSARLRHMLDHANEAMDLAAGRSEAMRLRRYGDADASGPGARRFVEIARAWSTLLSDSSPALIQTYRPGRTACDTF
jgi:hypothetical protein